ncbi:MAG: TIGR01212 family radical SAM protein [Desulfovibrio sp.]|nr:MAG: TIGR01212 family radical SAM protein [Desulfovibrio sp.]
MNDLSQRYHSLSRYFRRELGGRVQKIPLDAGFSCPNRDGTLSKRGCIYCNEKGSGTGGFTAGKSLAEQWDHWRSRYERKYPGAGFMAYLQAFSNTYGPYEKLAHTLNRITGQPVFSDSEHPGPLPGLVGLAVGTRPDCLDQDKLDLLAAQPVQEIWLEMGLQSANNTTLQRINRGHDFACFTGAVEAASGLVRPGGAQSGIKVCVHLIAGLPGEDKDDFLSTVQQVSALPIHGVKFHNLYVCRNTPLARIWQQGEYSPLAQAEYVDWLGQALTLLRPEIVVQRLTGDPAHGELLAPQWSADKSATLALLAATMTDQDLWQGKGLSEHEHTRPDW